jgi:hypothetical protein
MAGTPYHRGKGRCYRCSHCGEYVATMDDFELHRYGLTWAERRCRTEAEARRVGLRRNVKGVWRYQSPEQLEALSKFKKEVALRTWLKEDS